MARPLRWVVAEYLAKPLALRERCAAKFGQSVDHSFFLASYLDGDAPDGALLRFKQNRQVLGRTDDDRDIDVPRQPVHVHAFCRARIDRLFALDSGGALRERELDLKPAFPATYQVVHVVQMSGRNNTCPGSGAKNRRSSRLS